MSFTGFISKIGGFFSPLMLFFSLLTSILVNPNDNIRIYYFLKNNKPLFYERTKDVIKDFYQNPETKINDAWDNKNIDDIKEKDKLFYLFFNCCFCCKNKCCKKKINKH